MPHHIAFVAARFFTEPDIALVAGEHPVPFVIPVIPVKLHFDIESYSMR